LQGNAAFFIDGSANVSVNKSVINTTDSGAGGTVRITNTSINVRANGNSFGNAINYAGSTADNVVFDSDTTNILNTSAGASSGVIAFLNNSNADGTIFITNSQITATQLNTSSAQGAKTNGNGTIYINSSNFQIATSAGTATGFQAFNTGTINVLNSNLNATRQAVHMLPTMAEQIQST
jgi:hypothetical protein